MDSSKFSVLYVDDEEHNLTSFRATFRHYYQVFTAKSAMEAIQLLRQNWIPIIITDQRMPEMTGVQFLEKILPEFPDSIRMILTGFSDIEAIVQAINTGRIFRYITKPWDENELHMTIDNAINLYKLQQKNKELLSNLNLRLNEMEKTLRLFRKYVPEPVIERTLSAADEAGIFQGELIEVSALFCDIRNFTEISSELIPTEVVKLLNDFYTVMSQSVMRHNGYVNQYIGDEIFASFGAPLTYPENHSNAVYCALDMVKGLEAINESVKGKIKQKIHIGIGINTGLVVAGNLGSDYRIEYSITGDTVNIAKRIESLTKDFPDSILINQSTRDHVSELFELKQWEPVTVKGKKEMLQLYEVLGKKQ